MCYPRLRELREENGLEQAEVAKALDVSRKTYARYESDTRSIPLRIAEKRGDFYGVTLDYLVGRSDKRLPAPQR